MSRYVKKVVKPLQDGDLENAVQLQAVRLTKALADAAFFCRAAVDIELPQLVPSDPEGVAYLQSHLRFVVRTLAEEEELVASQLFAAHKATRRALKRLKDLVLLMNEEDARFGPDSEEPRQFVRPGSLGRTSASVPV